MATAGENDPDLIFGWQVYPEGRIRFGGLARGSDEGGHDSFIVDLDGVRSFSEIAIDPTLDRNRYGLMVVSVGWTSEAMIGGPADPLAVRSFSPAQVQRVRRLLAQLVATFARREKRPAFFFRPDTAFTGSVCFAAG